MNKIISLFIAVFFNVYTSAQINAGSTKESLMTLDEMPSWILTYIIHSGFISGYQNRYGDNLKPPTNVYHRMTA